MLILGESGTGKELAARQLPRASAAPGVHFSPSTAWALRPLLLSDLFGHARGAFSGEDHERRGAFESAHGATVLLEESGDLPLPTQGACCRAW